MICNTCGQTIPHGMERCPNCEKNAKAISEKSVRRPEKVAAPGFFSFGADLSDVGERESVPEIHTVVIGDENTHTCPVCSAQISTCLCPDCGFDSSRDYEQYPTLQDLGEVAHAISYLKAQWETSAEPSVGQAIAFLRRQGWEEYVLSAVEDILRCAEDGLFTRRHHVEIWEGDASDEKESEPPVPKPLPELSQFCAICGTSNDPGRLYCLGCGVKLRRAEKKVDSGNAKKPEGLRLSKFCKHCGAHVLGGAIYCTTCGAKIG